MSPPLCRAPTGSSSSWRTTPKANDCSSSEPRASSAVIPASWAVARAARPSSVLPTPAGPSITTSVPSPARARANPSPTVLSSRFSLEQNSPADGCHGATIQRTRGVRADALPTNLAFVMQRVLVFCGSSPGARAEYAQRAAALGRLIAGRGLDLVYGGAAVGLMGASPTPRSMPAAR